MSKIALAVAALVIVFGGYLYLQQGTPVGEMKNADMLAGEGAYAISTSTVTYFENATGLLARPTEPGSYPGVVMIHENRGLRPEIRATAEQLAAEGYIVLAVDLYKGQVVETQEEARAISGTFEQEEAIENMRAAVAYLKREGTQKIASLGWCFGGRQSLELATSGEELDATIVYYGGGMATSTEELAPIDWPVLGIFGDQDRAIPAETVDQFQMSLNELGVENEIHVYPGVGHAFANPSGMNYAPAETRDAWEKTVTFLARTLK